jgi:membrane protease YdiL (CAAX protease family)
MEPQPAYTFAPLLKRRDTAVCLTYLPLHVFVFPILIALAGPYYPSLSDSVWNLIYYVAGVVFLGVFMLPYLRRQFDAFLDRRLPSLFAILGAYFMNTLLSYLLFLLMNALGDMGTTPNDELVMSMTGRDLSIVKGLAIFLAPVLEETLFRGAVFGALRPRSRIPAYAASVLLFSLYHVWQFALADMDAAVLLYALQYVPVSIALCWCFERSGSLWAPILLHMGINAFSFAYLPYLT